MKTTAFVLLIIYAFAIAGCQSAKNDDFAIYLVAQDIPATEASKLDLGQLVLEKEPLISGDDIVSYDRATHTIELTRAAYARVQRIFPMPVKVNGIPFVVCVGKERIYAGGFWTPASSLSFDGVIIMQPFDPQPTPLQISLGYPAPEVFTGKDPRADPRIITALERDKKLK